MSYTSRKHPKRYASRWRQSKAAPPNPLAPMETNFPSAEASELFSNAYSAMTATPNHALQRTGVAVTAPASAAAFPPAMQGPRQPRPSLSLGSLGDFTPSVCKMRFLILIAASILAVGCSRSGTWTDDPKTWTQVIGNPPPNFLKVVHSRYWQSLSNDTEYFFAFGPSEIYRNNILSLNMMLPFAPDTAEKKEQVQRFRHAKPSWFIPKDIGSYDIWQGKPPHKTFRLFIDRETGAIFQSYYSP